MPETDTNASSNRPLPPRPTKQEMIRHFWALTKELIGVPAVGYVPSKSAALKVCRELGMAQSEGAARQSMLANPEGTRSLLAVTVSKATLDGWDMPEGSIGSDKSPVWKMDHASLIASGTDWFFLKAVEEFPVTP